MNQVTMEPLEFEWEIIGQMGTHTLQMIIRFQYKPIEADSLVCMVNIRRTLRQLNAS